jgi:hypothetical protein
MGFNFNANRFNRRRTMPTKTDVSSTTLFRKARAATSKRRSDQLRKLAAAKRRQERADARTGAAKPKRIAKAKARLDKQARNVAARKPKRANKIIAGLQEAFNHSLSEQIGASDTTETTEQAQQRAALMNAKYEGMEAQERIMNDAIVCSIIGSYENTRSQFPHNAPWSLSGAEMRGLMEVLRRAGYSMYGAPTCAMSNRTATGQAPTDGCVHAKAS